MLIDENLRAILTNGRRGPEALVLQRDPPDQSAPPEAPWPGLTVSTYLDVNYPTNTSGLYQFQIRGFFREHPVFVVKAFGRHERAFRFAAAHCIDDYDNDGDRGDHARPHDGEAADEGGSSGTPSPQESGAPSPQEGEHHQNGQPAPEALASGGTDLPLPPDGAAVGRSTGRLSTKRIGIAAGGLLMVLGVPATAWLRRRRRQRAARSEQEPATSSASDVTSHQEPGAPPTQPRR
ncbi:hypothetical protein ACFU7Y_02040 [Kitasatospora sp. NPDC057542]|uniref:hypothetical protein n=1 Tax=Kitasatospora sp. NPDC057542 TaxID=3346162 RepID=UPI0036B1AD5C